ncbi:phosphotransferase [Streptomyces populi]
MPQLADETTRPDAVPDWCRDDWPQTVLDLVDGQLLAAGLRRTGTAVPVRQWSISAVLRIPTTAGTVWFKRVPDLFAHEGRVMAWVAGRRPDIAPGVIGAGDGWLLSAHMPAQPGHAPDQALASLARFQRQTVGKARELALLGCPDRGLEHMLTDMEALAGRTDLLGAEAAHALRAVLPAFASLLDDVSRAGLPATLVHGDVQEDNAAWTGESWMFIDWTDCGISHPFVDLVRPLKTASAARWTRARAAVACVWADLVPERDLDVALDAAPALGAAYQAESHRRIVDAVGPGDGFLEQVQDWVHRLVTALNSPPLSAYARGARP